MEDKSIITLAALILLSLIELYALSLGMDGTLLAAVVGIFAFAVGVPVGVKYQESKK
jgi:hypothetical protein